MLLLHPAAQVAAQRHPLARGHHRHAKVGPERVVAPVIAERVQHRPAIALRDRGQEADGAEGFLPLHHAGDIAERCDVAPFDPGRDALGLECVGDAGGLGHEACSPVALLLPPLRRLRPPGVAPEQLLEAERRSGPVALL